MRYIILNKHSKKEKKSRKKFIEKATKLYFYPQAIEQGIEFVSIPSRNDYSIIVGHNFDIVKYLNKNDVKEKNLVLVTCKILGNILNIKNKKIYMSKQNSLGKTLLYDGKERNLDFDITDSEIEFLFHNGTVDEKINAAFERKCL